MGFLATRRHAFSFNRKIRTMVHPDISVPIEVCDYQPSNLKPTLCSTVMLVTLNSDERHRLLP